MVKSRFKGQENAPCLFSERSSKVKGQGTGTQEEVKAWSEQRDQSSTCMP